MHYYYNSVIGLQHQKNNIPCQDYSLVEEYQEHIIMICADGAGSSYLSDIGSKLICDFFIKNLKLYISERFTIDSHNWKKRKLLLIKVFRKSLSELYKFTLEKKINFKDVLTTINVAIKTKKSITSFSIGDGFIVFRPKYRKFYNFILSPNKGEYKNTTYFIDYFLNKNLNDILKDEIFKFNIVTNSEIEFVFLSTDGLENISLQNNLIYQPFFKTLEEAFRNNSEDFKNWFINDSELINRTLDDRSIIIWTDESIH